MATSAPERKSILDKSDQDWILVLVLGLVVEVVAQESKENYDAQLIAVLNERAANATERASSLENQTITLKKQAAEAQKATADAQAEADLVKAHVLWRWLTDSQCVQLTRSLNGTTGSLWVESVFGDPEATSFAISISNCFAHAGWTISYVTIGVGEIVLPLNLTIGGENQNKVDLVRNALGAIGFKCGTNDEAIEQGVVSRFAVIGRGPKEVKIIVGSRPIFQ